MLQSVYLLANEQQFSRWNRSHPLNWDRMTPGDRFLFPGLASNQRLTQSNKTTVERIGTGSKLLLPTLVLVGGWALRDRPLIATTSLILLASLATYSDIKSHGQLRTFETGVSLILPGTLLSIYNGYSRNFISQPTTFDELCASLLHLLPSGGLIALYCRAMTVQSNGEKELLDQWGRNGWTKQIEAYKKRNVQSSLASLAQLGQIFLPSVGFALYKTVRPHFALLGGLGVGSLALWTSQRYCTEKEAQPDKRSLQASTTGLLIAAILGFGATFWPRG